MSWDAARKKRYPWTTDAEYNQHWLIRVRANCVRTESGCLLWQGGLHPKGYGQTCYRVRTVRIHRKLYEITRGVTLPPEVLVCHSCDIRNCCEETHLWPGSNDDNQDDAHAKGRKRMQSATHCARGHEYTPENTRRYSPLFRRTCLTCARARLRIAAGWPEEIAFSAAVPHGHRPVNAKFPRRRKAA